MADEKREIKLLYCPSTTKLVPYVATDSDRIDIGGIARVFGLHPATLKINGHFIGRGPDLIASSVTWKGLISFFNGRGLPTGAQRSIVVHGKILKPGNKRIHEPPDVEEMGNKPSGDDTCGRTSEADIGPSKKCKLSNSGFHSHDIVTSNNFCHKRKHFLLDNVSLMKKLKIDETESRQLHEGPSSEAHNLFSKPLKSHCTCCYSSQKMKRRLEETVVAMTLTRTWYLTHRSISNIKFLGNPCR